MATCSSYMEVKFVQHQYLAHSNSDFDAKKQFEQRNEEINVLVCIGVVRAFKVWQIVQFIDLLTVSLRSSVK